MLKKYTIGVLVFAAILSLSVMAYAEEAIVVGENMIVPEDSKIISDDIMLQLNADDNSETLRIYNVAITFAFAEHDNISDVLTSGEMLEVFYAVKDENNEYNYFAKTPNTFEPKKVNRVNSQAMRMCETGEAIPSIADDVIVYNTYYLSGESNQMGTAIYYKTNKGDFVYYNHYSLGEYLFPIDAFCAYQKAVMDEMEANAYLDGSIDLRAVWDLSPYDFRSASFNLNAEIPKNKGSAQENVGDTSTSVDTTDTSKDNLIASGEQQRDETNSTKIADGDKNQTWIFVTIGACLLISAIAIGVFIWERKSKV